MDDLNILQGRREALEGHRVIDVWHETDEDGERWVVLGMDTGQRIMIHDTTPWVFVNEDDSAELEP